MHAIDCEGCKLGGVLYQHPPGPPLSLSPAERSCSLSRPSALRATAAAVVSTPNKVPKPP